MFSLFEGSTFRLDVNFVIEKRWVNLIFPCVLYLNTNLLKKRLAPLLHLIKCDISTQLGKQISFYQIEEESDVPNSLLHERFSCHISRSNLRSSQGLRLRSGGIACCMACMARKLKKWRLIMILSWIQLGFAVATCNLFFRSKILLWQCSYGGLNIGLEASASVMLKIASFLVCFHIQKLTTTLTNIGHGFIHFISCNQNPTQRVPCHTGEPVVPSGSIRLEDFSQGRACNH